jgi:hypothetical protein
MGSDLQYTASYQHRLADHTSLFTLKINIHVAVTNPKYGRYCLLSLQIVAVIAQVLLYGINTHTSMQKFEAILKSDEQYSPKVLLNTKSSFESLSLLRSSAYPFVYFLLFFSWCFFMMAIKHNHWINASLKRASQHCTQFKYRLIALSSRFSRTFYLNCSPCCTFCTTFSLPLRRNP